MVETKVDILAIGVHPDDIELGCGATILKQIHLGYKIGFVDLTQGELGTRGNAQLRLQEAEKARIFGGVDFRENLGMKDGFFQNTTNNKLRIIEMIRKYQPEIVLANAVIDRHPDHGRASQLIYDAVFLSGLIKVETSLDGINQDPWRPRKLLNYIQDYDTTPDVVVNVSGFIDKKIEMVMQYSSQFFDPNSKEPQTPISSKAFIDGLKGRAIAHGRRIGVKYGEGFTCASYIGVEDIMKVL